MDVGDNYIYSPDNLQAAQHVSSMPGRVILRLQPWQAPITGEEYQLIQLTRTFEINKVIVTADLGRTIVPALADGTVPPTTSYLRQCQRCHSVISVWNTFTCKCGYDFCLACRGTEGSLQLSSDIEEYGDYAYRRRYALCVECERRDKAGLVHIISSLIWKL